MSNSLPQVILVPLMYLGWGRGGLLGEGSSVVELGENPVPWSNPRDLDIRWKRVALFREGVGGLDSFIIFHLLELSKVRHLLIGYMVVFDQCGCSSRKYSNLIKRLTQACLFSNLMQVRS